MYKIKDKYKSLIARYAWTKLDTNCAYDLDTWIAYGFKEYILEKI